MNHNHPNPTFVPMPAMFGFQPQQQAGNEIPARVAAVMMFLRHLTDKTASELVGNDVGFETQAGQDLTVAEQVAQKAACEMLTSYFQGRLMPSNWEAVEYSKDLPGVAICPVCLADVEKRRTCDACNRQGMVTVPRVRS